MPTERVRDIELYYEARGEGPPILFISGTGGDLRRRPNVFDSPLPDHGTVLAYDQRGLGRSSKPDGPYTMADYAADAAALLAHVGWARASVVGVSFGGMVAQELAIGWPERVERLVLCCTSSGGDGGSSYPLHELAELTAEDRLRAHLAISDERYDRAWQEAHPDEAEQLLALMRAAEEQTAADPQSVAGARHQLEARRDHDTFDRLDAVTAPTLVCAGRYDALAPLGNSRALAGQIEGADLQVFEGGHLFLLQDRQSWPAIVAFLDGGRDQ